MSEGSRKIELVTTDKQDLFDIGEALALAMERPFLLDPATPVVVSVNGSMTAGKSILSTSLREAVMGVKDECRLVGKKGYDERWFGTVDGREIEVDYIDIAYGSDYHNPELNRNFYPDRETAFLKQREKGGISIIQNKAPLAELYRFYNQVGKTAPSWKGRSRDELKVAPTGMEIWLESDFFMLVYDADQRRIKGSSLVDAFRAAGRECILWLRYVEINVNDARLLQSPRFQAACDRLSSAAGDVAALLKEGCPAEKIAGKYKQGAFGL